MGINKAVHQLFIAFKKAYDSVKGRAFVTFSSSSISPRKC
jgi:hypothetical protein